MTTAASLHTILGNADPSWESTALAAIETLAASGRSFTAADLAGLGVVDPDHPCRWGSVMAKAKKLGLVRRIGYRPSPRPSRSAGVCAVWAAPTITTRNEDS